MPRKPRFYVPGVPVHVIQRGNNRQDIFFNDADNQVYLKWVGEALSKYQCKLHAYVLMTNHVHLLITPHQTDTVSKLMQYIGRQYVPYVNTTYNRTGTLWEGRYRSSLVQHDRYLLACMRYIELNPVRAKMVNYPGDYFWSSYHANAHGINNALIDPHEVYLGIAEGEVARHKCYRALFSRDLDLKQLTEIRNACQTGTPLGDDRFKTKIEKTLKTKVGEGYRGRPRKQTKKKGSDPFES